LKIGITLTILRSRGIIPDVSDKETPLNSTPDPFKSVDQRDAVLPVLRTHHVRRSLHARNISGRRQQKKSLKPIQKLATHPALRSLISLIRKMNGQINDKWSGRRKNTVQRNEENKKNTTGISLGYRSLKNN
jgi:hypothetical protein